MDLFLYKIIDKNCFVITMQYNRKMEYVLALWLNDLIDVKKIKLFCFCAKKVYEGK